MGARIDLTSMSAIDVCLGVDVGGTNVEFGSKGQSVAVTVFVAPHTPTQRGAQADSRGVKSVPVDKVAAELSPQASSDQHFNEGERLGSIARVTNTMTSICSRTGRRDGN